MSYLQTLASIGWSASLSPADQRQIIQTALNAGPCALEWPCGETVQIDQGLVAPYPVHIAGHGCDITNTASALSQIRTTAPNINILQLLASNSIVENINLHSDAQNTTGYGVLIGDGTIQPQGVHLKRVSTCSNVWRGIGIISGQELTVEDCFANAQDAAFCTANVNSDSGDNRIEGGEFNAYGSLGACIRILSGGGLMIGGGAKLLNGWNHIAMAWHQTGSGGLQVGPGVSMENCHSTVSCDIDGSAPFERMIFEGISWGNYSTPIQVRSSHSVKWLKQLIVADNLMKVMGPPNLSAVDLDYCDEVNVRGNNIDGTGQAYTGIITRANCTGRIGENVIRNLTGQYPSVMNQSGTGVTVAPQG
jgi:hypothetical protein